jgi:hypothetical protein
MKLIVIIILILLGMMAILVAAWFYVELKTKDPPDGTVITYEEDEYSPEQLDLDKTLKIISLRNKLKEIETKRKKK